MGSHRSGRCRSSSILIRRDTLDQTVTVSELADSIGRELGGFKGFRWVLVLTLAAVRIRMMRLKSSLEARAPRRKDSRMALSSCAVVQ